MDKMQKVLLKSLIKETMKRNQTSSTHEHLNKRQRIGETPIEENPYLTHLNKPVCLNQANSALDGFILGKTLLIKPEKQRKEFIIPSIVKNLVKNIVKF
jgi:hypothetical protein